MKILNFDSFINEAKKEKIVKKSYKALLTGLKKCINEYGNTGPHYEGTEVIDLEKALVTDYPEFTKEIEKIFSLMGDVSNNMSDLENEDIEDDREYAKIERESKKYEESAKKVLDKVKEKIQKLK